MSKRRKSPAQAAAAPKREKRQDVFVARPFEGLADEPDWVALRELVPAAAAVVRLTPEMIEKYGDREITVATVLPMAWPAMTKPDGRVFLGLQRHVQSGDPSRDVALALVLALESEPGGPVSVPPLPGPGDRLQDVLADGALDVVMHDGFDFWLDEGADSDAEVKQSLERANASVLPTVKLTSARSAYWCRVPDKSHIRWVLADDETPALNALARLAAAGELGLGEGTRFAGMFRAHGLLVPVWDLPREPEAAEWEQPMADFASRYVTALAVDEDLTAAERRSRQGLLGRQLTLR